MEPVHLQEVPLQQATNSSYQEPCRFTAANEMHFNAWTQVFPAPELPQSTWLGRFTLEMLVQLTPAECSDHPTVCDVLLWIADLATVFMQNLAAVKVLHPEHSVAGLEREPLVLRRAKFNVSIDEGIAL